MIIQCICGNTSRALEHSRQGEEKIYDIPRFETAVCEDETIGLVCEQCKRLIPLKAKKCTLEEMRGSE